MANGIMAPDENWPKCEDAVNKALELDNTLAEAYNPQAAVKSITTAIGLPPKAHFVAGSI